MGQLFCLDSMRDTTTFNKAQQLPPELLLHILEYLKNEPVQLLVSCSRVCIEWNLILMKTTTIKQVQSRGYNPVQYAHLRNRFWKHVVLYTWPTFNPDLRISDWYSVFKRRFRAKLYNSTANLIDNCIELQYKCPLIYDELQSTGDEDVKFCNTCKKKVYHCWTMDQLKKHSMKGDCVAFFPEYEDHYEMGLI